MNTIIEIEGNDLTQGRGNNYYAVSHPRFVEHRFDKKRTITMNNVSYGAGTIMWDRAKQYCDRENGEFIQYVSIFLFSFRFRNYTLKN